MDSTTAVWDSFDVDLVVKVLNNTLFSPFFTALIPTFFFFQGERIASSAVVATVSWFVAVSLFWLVKWLSLLYRNQGSLLFGPPPLDWSQQIVLITGGASGVGELLANTLAVRNVTVVVLDLNPIVTENYNISYYRCDVSKWEEVERVAKTVIEEVGNPTILINNAGVVQGKLLTDLSVEDINQTFGVNTLAHFWTLKAFLPGMIEQKTGHVVTVSSVMAIAGAAQMSDYCASKAALVALNDALRYELDKRYKCPNIRTTLIMPGHINTPMFSQMSLPASRLYKFLVPSVQPVDMTKAIIASLDERHSKTVYLPFYANFAGIFNLMPSFIRDVGQWYSGADFAMEGFAKVSGKREDELKEKQ